MKLKLEILEMMNMARCRLYSDSILRPILRQELSKEDYDRVSKRLINCPKVDAIPEAYILNYAPKHDAVCEMNLRTLLDRFHADSGGGDDRHSGT